MKFYKKAIVFISILIVTGNSFIQSQTDFRPGYIITLKWDTVFGQLDSRGAIENGKSCSFRKSEQDIAISYEPAQINAYRFIDGKYYISRAIPDTIGERLVFLEYLMHGITDLYYYKTSEKERYYIQKQGGPFVELSNDAISRHMSINPLTNTVGVSTQSDIESGNTSGVYSRDSKKYLGVLNATFADCEALRGKINRTEFNPASLVKIAKKYHEYMCDSFQCLVYEKKVGAQFRFAPIVRLNYSSVSFNTKDGLEDKLHMYPRQFYTYLNHPMTLNYGLGLMMDISSTRSNEKFSVQVEAVITRSNFRLDGTEIQFSRVVNHIVDISGYSSEDCISVKYSYPKGTLRPTAFMGGNAIIALGTKAFRTTETIYNNQSSTTIYKDVPTSNNYVGFSGGLGLDLVVEKKKCAFIQFKLEKYFGEIIGSRPNSGVFALNTNIGIYL